MDAKDYALKLLSSANPCKGFRANPRYPDALATFGSGAGGAILTASFNAMLTDRLPKNLHIPAHAVVALGTLALPSSKLSAGIGGAAFYALFSETYYGYLRGSIVSSAKQALK